MLDSLPGRYPKPGSQTLRVLADARAFARHVNLGTERSPEDSYLRDFQEGRDLPRRKWPRLRVVQGYRHTYAS